MKPTDLPGCHSSSDSSMTYHVFKEDSHEGLNYVKIQDCYNTYLTGMEGSPIEAWDCQSKEQG